MILKTLSIMSEDNEKYSNWRNLTECIDSVVKMIVFDIDGYKIGLAGALPENCIVKSEKSLFGNSTQQCENIWLEVKGVQYIVDGKEESNEIVLHNLTLLPESGYIKFKCTIDNAECSVKCVDLTYKMPKEIGEKVCYLLSC